MRRLSVFNQISLDGYFRRLDGDVSWTHTHDDDAEFNEFVTGNASGEGPLLFGRTTYEMMAGFWPTPSAAQQFPDLAKRMNALPKIVASRTLREAAWSNTWNVAPVTEMPLGENAIFRYELQPQARSTMLTVTYRRMTKRTAPGFLPGTHAFLDRLGAQLDGAGVPDWLSRFQELLGEYPDWTQHAT